MRIMATAPSRMPEAGNSWGRTWLSFLGQVALVTGVELSDEFIRGMIAESDSHAGRINAEHIMQFEMDHGFWVEPGWQLFFMRTHHLLGIAFTWQQIMHLANAIYLLGHIFITLLFAIWIFVARRQIFAFVRNIFFITNALALVLYEAYPLAPPRLAQDLIWEGRPYRFVDTLFGVFDAHGTQAGTQFGFNEFAAMPSLHFGWALIVGLTLAGTLRPLVLRLLALLYPLVMLVAIVITGNHYLMDAVGATGLVCMAVLLALLYAWWREGRPAVGGFLRSLYGLRHDSSLTGTTDSTVASPMGSES